MYIVRRTNTHLTFNTGSHCPNGFEDDAREDISTVSIFCFVDPYIYLLRCTDAGKPAIP